MGRHTPCNVAPERDGDSMFHDLAIVLYTVTAGFTASGITANVYRLIAEQLPGAKAKTIYFSVMTLAGPSVVFENAAKSRRKKDCSNIAFWLAAMVAGYWSFVIGLFVIELAITLFR